MFARKLNQTDSVAHHLAVKLAVFRRQLRGLVLSHPYAPRSSLFGHYWQIVHCFAHCPISDVVAVCANFGCFRSTRLWCETHGITAPVSQEAGHKCEIQFSCEFFPGYLKVVSMIKALDRKGTWWTYSIADGLSGAQN